MVRTGNIDSDGAITPFPSDFNIAGQAQGDVLYFDGSNWVKLDPGTDGQVLKTQGAAADPEYGLSEDLTIGSQATGDMLFYNGTNWIRIAAGTEGQLLTAHGAAVPTWETAGAGGATILAQNDTFTTANLSITIEDNHHYLIFVRANTVLGANLSLGIRFDNSSSAAYKFATNIAEMDSTPNANLQSLDGQTSIKPTGTTILRGATADGWYMRAFISTEGATGFGAVIEGALMGRGQNIFSTKYEFMGITTSTTTSSINLVALTGSFTGEYWLYEYQMS